MKFPSTPSSVRPLLWFLVSLALFLSAGTAATIVYQRHLIREEMTLHVEREVRLLGNIVQASLSGRDIAAAQRDLDLFCRDHDEIAEALLAAPDGHALAACRRTSGSGDVLPLSRTVTYGKGQQAVLAVSLDLGAVGKRLRSLAVTMGTASFVFALCIGLLLWRILRATAFRPLEQAVQELKRTKEQLELRVAERTAEWMLSNKELKQEIAERSAAEQQLAIKDRAIASSISGIALADFDGKLTYVNDSFLGLWGYERTEEVLGRDAAEFWQSTSAAEEIIPVLRDRGAWMGELTARRKDGGTFEAQLAADIVRDNEGAPICMMASFIDVTERKRTEKALRKQKDFTAVVLDIVGAIMVVLDRDGKVVRFNRECERISQYTAAETVGKFIWDLVIPPEDVAAVKRVFRELTAGRFPNRHENPWVARDGSRRLISWSNTCITGENGDVEFVIATGIDITQSRAAEEALRSSEARHRLVMENIDEIVYQVSIADEADPFRASVEFVSGRVRNIVGHGPEEFLRNPHLWLGMIHRDDHPEIRESARRMVAERTGGTRVYRVRHGVTGEYVWMEGKVVPRLDDQGRLTGYFGVARDITKRKETEDALQAAVVRAEEEKNKSTAVIAAIGDAISIQDRDFRVLYQNDKHRSMVGDHVGEYCHQAYEKQPSVCSGCPVAVSFADGKVHTAERRGVSADGREVFVEVTTSPLRDASGRIIAGIEVARDITARKQMEQGLRIALETQSVINALLKVPSEDAPLPDIMQQALEIILKSTLYSFHSIGGIFLLDEATKRLSLAAQKGFGAYILDACREVPVGTCLCGRAAASGQIEFASDLDERHEIRFPGIEPHGHYCVPILLAGRPAGVLALYLEQGHARDLREEEFLRSVASALAVLLQRANMEAERGALISDLRRLLEVVSLSQQEWRATFDGITDPIVVLGADRNIRKANRAFSSLLGLRPQDVINQDCLGLLYHGQTPPVGDPLLRGLREARPVEGEIIESGSKRTYRVSVFPSATSEKEPPGAIAVLKDVTDEREREMRLIMSERLASLGQMASGIAHEINNPLASIAGCVDGMSRRVSRNQFEPELFQRYLGIIKGEIARSKNITTSMLSIVRTSSYEQKLVSLPAVIDATLEIIGYQGRLRQTEVVKDYRPGLPSVLGSEGEIRQVLLILITNALDAMQDRGRLWIRTGIEEGGISIDITDTGPGIPAELLQRIFDPFFTTKSDRGGTGLGLSIAQRIVAGHKGSLAVLSHEAGGAAFRLTLPVMPPSAGS